MFADTLKRYWWTTLLRGVIWILFGIVLFAQPGISLVTLTLTFGAFVLVDGIANVVSAIGGGQEKENRWLLLLVGLLGIGVGVLTFFSPGATALALLFYIAIWSIASGLLWIVAAVRLRNEIEGEFWLALSGLRLDRVWRVARGTTRRGCALGDLVDRGLRNCVWCHSCPAGVQGAWVREAGRRGTESVGAAIPTSQRPRREPPGPFPFSP